MTTCYSLQRGSTKKIWRFCGRANGRKYQENGNSVSDTCWHSKNHSKFRKKIVQTVFCWNITILKYYFQNQNDFNRLLLLFFFNSFTNSIAMFCCALAWMPCSEKVTERKTTRKCRTPPALQGEAAQASLTAVAAACGPADVFNRNFYWNFNRKNSQKIKNPFAKNLFKNY